MKQDLMEIEVICTNCNHEATISIPKGALGGSYYGNNPEEFVECNNCGYRALIKKKEVKNETRLNGTSFQTEIKDFLL